MKWNALTIVLPVALAGCSSMYPAPNLETQDRISSEMARASARPASKESVAVPASVLNALVQPSVNSFLPKPTRGAAAQRFDLVVTDAPIGQVLAGLVAGTDYSVLIKPATQASPDPVLPNTGIKLEAVDVASKRVTFNLKNITLFEALDAIRDVYGYDYTVENNRILVQPAELQTRLYHVNYISGQRRGVSDLQVIGGASVGQSSSSSTSSSTSSTTSSSSYGSVQATGVSTTVKADIWNEAEDALRTALGCNIPKVAAAPVTGQRLGGAAMGGSAAQSGNASRADVTHPGDASQGERLRGVDGCSQGRALVINQMSGTILVRAMPTEHRLVEKLLHSMQLNISRQVIIESKVIDVELNKDSQQGINWGQFSNGAMRYGVGADPTAIGAVGGAVSSTQTLAGLLGTNTSPPGGLTNTAGIAVSAKNFSALINFLETQGRLHVLSSPRISTLNNQKAVIKVGSEEPFVTSISGGSTVVAAAGSAPVITPPTMNYQPFFSGIALDVTPQIDAEDNITLHVHSMVNQVVEKEKLALPTASATVPFAVNTINETDSVVKAKDGQIIVIGGLMTESNSDTRGGIPGARDVPGVGALFNWGTQTFSKRELVILLKSTVVRDDSAWANDISATGERLGGMEAAHQ